MSSEIRADSPSSQPTSGAREFDREDHAVLVDDRGNPAQPFVAEDYRKRYAPWVKARQEHLEAAVRKAW
jgi:hypothetical protein